MKNKIIDLVIFGGGLLLFTLASEIAKKKYNKKFRQKLILSERHQNEIIYNNLTLKECLKKKKISYQIKKKIDNNLKNKIPKNALGLSIGAAWFFSKSFINSFNGKFFNIHSSDLPKDRGGGGFTWQILMERKDIYATIHLIVPGIDKGNIVFKNKFLINKIINPDEIQTKYSKLTKSFLMKKLNHLAKNKIRGKKQNETKSSYWPRLNSKIHGWIDWGWKAKEILLFIRAFDDPYIGAHTKLNKKTVYLKDCYLNKSKIKFHPFQTGIIFRKDKNYIYVACGKYVLKIKKIFEGRNKIIPLKKIKIGDRFHTSRSILDKSLSTRVLYTSNKLKV